MSKLPTIISFSAFLLLVGFSSCNPDTQAQTEDKPIKVNVAEKIPFHWESTSALRNGKATASLEGLFFDFSAPGFLTTNLMGTKQTAPCQIKDNMIHQLGDNPIVYEIADMSDAKMVLKMTMNETPFQFNLEKKAAPEQ